MEDEVRRGADRRLCEGVWRRGGEGEWVGGCGGRGLKKGERGGQLELAVGGHARGPGT